MLKKLEDAYEAAIQEQARLRNRKVTNFDREISVSIFTAGLLAYEDSELGVAQYRVVSAPTGSGKSSYAQAFAKALIQAHPEGSVLFLVETIQQAEDTYRDMSALIGRANVAVWTSAHDRRSSPDTIRHQHGFVPERRFSVDDLAKYPVVIATHRFYMGSRASKATEYRGKPRKLTFVDEKPADVSIFDIDTGLIKTVRDRLAEKHTSNLKHVAQLTMLHDHLEAVWQTASGKASFDEILEAGNIDLTWFNSEQANDYIASSDDQVQSVFAFGRALAKGFAFLSRYDEYGKGARFVGYEMNMPLRPGTVLLDATADIDGISLLVSNRKPVRVPPVDFSNLTIIHIEPDVPKGYTISKIIKEAKRARPYAEWIMGTIRQNSSSGENVLAVVHKGMLDHEYLPNDHRAFSDPLDLEGRNVCFIHWGSGIGSNRWKSATAVFLFGEFHVPKRAMVGTALGLKEEQATSATLALFQTPNPRNRELKGIREGHLLRWLKQIAMRGNARNIDANGVCGEQRLYVTAEFDRLIEHKDRVFPRAKLLSQRKPETRKDGGVKGLLSLLYSTDALEITTVELASLTRISFQKNKSRYLSNPLIKKAMKDTGFTFVAGKGRGNPGRFVRNTSLAA
ncbi:DEAD/DEAH box helicase family protein [Bradyrhizobium liaoningense]|uniref:DEAD/DEAH box helicase family protein n=1 Tax=Bradyrhizobium liaoningense TaxID=43992 RepID=UPI001BAE46F5|nr:DEAD/DEAH box helicase family protein [Bradyrhizobium liaoningense]MBR0907391.1 DEAD/DEAH box helicase family protein [Bradyrhizobium liaoningense]